MHSPLFWKNINWKSDALLPVALIYGWLAVNRRKNITPQKLSVPVICIGNLVAGGAGKTPVALALGTMLKARGINAHFLSRGYKGKLQGPVQVNLQSHSAREVGDEPLLLAALLPTWIAKDRLQGAKAAIEAGAQLIIMDDGFQNPHIQKDISFLVIDGGYGFGNERLLPAGPLRESIETAMNRASALLLIGDDSYNALRHAPAGKPLMRARLMPTKEAEPLRGQQVVAFAGIARPRKFYRTLQQLDCTIRKMVAYPDHHLFSARDQAFLLRKAKELDAILVTTTKDYVRLPTSMQKYVETLPVEVILDHPDALFTLLPAL